MAPQTVEGVYENGSVRLTGAAPDVEKARVLVTFLSAGGAVDLQNVALSDAEAGNLRARLTTFAEDWNRPEMDAYDAL
ncbi:MAG: hypothetical protein H0V56_02620 [Chthoniobacterales bacterium]|nr:hypothetical protein [Chthoniobacterales bacterium]